MAQRTAYARERLAQVEGVELLHEQPVVREFAVRLDAPVDAVLRRCARARASTPATRSARDYPEFADGLLVAITERRSRARHRPAGGRARAQAVAAERRADEAVPA